MVISINRSTMEDKETNRAYRIWVVSGKRNNKTEPLSYLTTLIPFATLNILKLILDIVYTTMNTQNISIQNLPDLLTVREVAQLLRVSPLTIKRWGKRGKLPAIRINSRGDRRYKKEAVLWLLGIQSKTQ